MACLSGAAHLSSHDVDKVGRQHKGDPLPLDFLRESGGAPCDITMTTIAMTF